MGHYADDIESLERLCEGLDFPLSARPLGPPMGLAESMRESFPLGIPRATHLVVGPHGPRLVWADGRLFSEQCWCCGQWSDGLDDEGLCIVCQEEAESEDDSL